MRCQEVATGGITGAAGVVHPTERRKFSIAELRGMLTRFSGTRIVAERFPVKSRLHKGWKGALFNTFFVGTFNALPRPLVRRFGWHLLAFCRK